MNLSDPRQFIETFFLIMNKEERIVPFRLNAVQNLYLDSQTQLDIVLKARKQGISSLVLALFLWECLYKGNINAVVMAHEKESTIGLLERVKFYLEHLPLPATLSRESEDKLVFPNKNSSFSVLTAGQKSAGRSRDIHRLHLSEYASYEKIRQGTTHEIHAGAIQAVPKTGRIVIETTAEGVDTPFHNLWNSSEGGDTGWKTHFFAWYQSPEYSLPGDPLEKLSVYEKRIKDLYNLTDDQLRWRRHEIRAMPDAEYDEDANDWISAIFRQEFPISPEEAFISTRSCVFNANQIQKLYDKAPRPQHRGIFEDNGFRPGENGWVKIWKMPVEGHEYVIGADVGWGKEKGDWSVAYSIDSFTMEVVAEMRLRIAPDLYAVELYKFGMFYHGALIAPEWTGPGATTSLKLYEMNYVNIYKSKKYKKGFEEETEEIGVQTTGKSKELGVSMLKTRLRQGLKIYSKQALAEMMHFVYFPGRINRHHIRMEAEVGHDDCVMALVMCAFGLGDAPGKQLEQILPEIYSPGWFMEQQNRIERSRLRVGGYRRMRGR